MLLSSPNDPFPPERKNETVFTGKSLILIETLAEHPRGLTLSRLSELCGQPVSSIHHALSTFRERGFVAQNEETKKYSLGLKFLTISRAILDNLDIRTVAMEELQRLHDKTHEMVFLSVLRDRKVVYIDKIQAPGRLVLATEVGYAIEPHACTSGKALLAGLSDREIMDLYPDEALPPHHGNTIINTRTALLEELRKVREQGFSYGDEQYYQGRARGGRAACFGQKDHRLHLCNRACLQHAHGQNLYGNHTERTGVRRSHQPFSERLTGPGDGSEAVSGSGTRQYRVPALRGACSAGRAA